MTKCKNCKKLEKELRYYQDAVDKERLKYARTAMKLRDLASLLRELGIVEEQKV